MINGLLPIGSVVLIGNSQKKVMIVGCCQKGGSNPDRLWDYAGVIFPEGFLAPDKMVLFDNEQISQIYMIGYQDAEQLAFKTKVDALIQELRTPNDAKT